jgi:2,3-dihydroxybenzoate decarboxylase
MAFKGTVAVEEAVVSPNTAWLLQESQQILTPGDSGKQAIEAHQARLMDIHGSRLDAMNAEGVEYMLLSLTSPGCQGIPDQQLAEKTATEFNDWLAGEVAKNPSRFGGLAAISMHDPFQAASELERAVKESGFYGGIVNDYQLTGTDGLEKRFYDTPFYDPFWKKVQELDVPVYFHPRYPSVKELEAETSVYGSRMHLLGAGIQFHLDLSFHIYAMCSSGILVLFTVVTESFAYHSTKVFLIGSLD